MAGRLKPLTSARSAAENHGISIRDLGFGPTTPDFAKSLSSVVSVALQISRKLTSRRVSKMPTLFELGVVYQTKGVKKAFSKLDDPMKENPLFYLSRHVHGDYGEISAEDVEINNQAIEEDDERIMSAYTLSNGIKIWIITETDKSATTICLPSEY
jgi:hypothetical protein